MWRAAGRSGGRALPDVRSFCDAAVTTLKGI